MTTTTLKDKKSQVLFTFLVGISFAFVTQGLPTPFGRSGTRNAGADNPFNGTAICPQGWISATAPSKTFRNAQTSLCVRVNSRERSWEAARRKCRDGNGFLVKLDRLLMVDNTLLSDYLQQKGIDTVWTGMHHEYGTLMWDELRPEMVKSYYRAEMYAWKKRGWSFDKSSFRHGNETCGVLQIGDTGVDSRESAERRRPRKKRSPIQQPGSPTDGPTFQVNPRKDNEDQPNKTPTQIDEKRLESFQQFLSTQGFGESYVEGIGESNNGESQKSKTENSKSPEGTTISTTTTDQSNLEDDDHHFVTRRSTPKQVGTTKTPKTTTSRRETAAPKYQSQKTIQGTSLPSYTAPHTTPSPESATNENDLLNHLFQASLTNASVTNIGPDVINSNPSQFETAFASEAQVMKVAEQKNSAPSISSEAQSHGLESNEYLKNLLKMATVTFSPLNNTNSETKTTSDSNSRLLDGANGGDSIQDINMFAKTSTAFPRNQLDYNSVRPLHRFASLLAAKQNWYSTTTRSESPTTTVAPNFGFSSPFDHDSILNSVMSPEESQSKDSKKSDEFWGVTATTDKSTTDSASDSNEVTVSTTQTTTDSSSDSKEVTDSGLFEDFSSTTASTNSNSKSKEILFHFDFSQNLTSKQGKRGDINSVSVSNDSSEVVAHSDSKSIPVDSVQIFDTSEVPGSNLNLSPSSNDSAEVSGLQDGKSKGIDNFLIIDTPGSSSSKQNVSSASNDSMEVGRPSEDTSNFVDSFQIFDSSENNTSASNDSVEVVAKSLFGIKSKEVDGPVIFDPVGSAAGGAASNDSKEIGLDSNNSTASHESLLHDFTQSGSQEIGDGNDFGTFENGFRVEDNMLGGNGGDGPSERISLEECEEEHSSVCVTEAIEDLSLVGHCDRNWYGHRLLDRCYKPLTFTLTELEARQRCLHFSASLATADTHFYGNVTTILLNHFVDKRDFAKRVWVDTTLNLDIPVDNQCSALEDGQIHRVNCRSRLPFICQKDARISVPQMDEERGGSVTFVQNMTSFHPQLLWCPLRMSATDDVILWFKDGRPIIDEDDDEKNSFERQNGRMPNSLELDLSILEKVGEGGSRIPKPPMLQGEYWCEIWRRQPFRRVASHKMFLRFTDVIALHGYIKTEPISYESAAIFNRMGHLTALPTVMERRLGTMNKNITHFLRTILPVVRDVITTVKHVSPVDGRAEFITYICTATGDLGTHMRGNLADLYLSTFYEALVRNEDAIRKEWNLTSSILKAVKVTMTDMCPEANLVDRHSGLSATFPSTPVNKAALSRDACSGFHTGTAYCRGNLQTGAYWDSWRVTRTCYDQEQRVDSSESGEDDDSRSTDKDGIKSDEIIDTGDGFIIHKPPNPALLELDEVEIEADNVAHVTERLADVLDQTDDLSESDIETVAQVVDRIVSVNKPPAEVSDKLIKTVNKVLEAPHEHLQRAEQNSRAPSRLISDLESFGEKVDMGVDPRIRHVTPNLAMELWNLEDSNDVVIGFGATQTPSWSAPLSDPRIITIKDRTWAERNLPNFDIAIELPESLVKNTIRYSESSLRLSMFIYRKPGLFLQKQSGAQFADGQVNSAIISASLGGRKIRGLEDKIKLVFKPFKQVSTRAKDTHCVFWDTERENPRWSGKGCVYNGTMNGRDVCLCDHLTNFAVLLDFYGDERPISSEHETSLSILTLVGLSLSILGLAITIITFLAFKKLRQGRAQQTLFNMAIALLCFQTTFLVGIKQTSIPAICLSVAVLLHYFILVSFAWMLIEAVLQYLTFVKVLGTYISRYTLKTVLPAWGVPLIPVIAVLVTDYNLYLGRTNYCWMDLQAFYYAFALPVGIIIIFNVIMFFIIIISLVTRPKGLRSNQANNKTRETNLKAAFTIFVLLGLTWLFGYLAIEDARIPFQYAFTILSSMQGFLIFVLMVVRRRQARDHWESICCCMSRGKKHHQKKLSPTSSNSTTSNNSLSNSRTLPSFINHTYNGDEPMVLQGGLRRQTSITV